MGAVTVSELFREYERDFERLRQNIDDELAAGESSAQVLAQTERAAKEADQALRQMELEARTMPGEQRSALQPKLRQYRAELSERKAKLDEATQAAQRQALLGGDDRSCTAYGKPSKDRDRFLDANRQLEDASRRLEEATRETLASEQIGAEVMSDLRQQRDTISRSKGNLRTVGHNYGMSK